MDDNQLYGLVCTKAIRMLTFLTILYRSITSPLPHDAWKNVVLSVFQKVLKKAGIWHKFFGVRKYKYSHLPDSNANFMN